MRGTCRPTSKFRSPKIPLKTIFWLILPLLIEHSWLLNLRPYFIVLVFKLFYKNILVCFRHETSPAQFKKSLCVKSLCSHDSKAIVDPSGSNKSHIYKIPMSKKRFQKILVLFIFIPGLYHINNSFLQGSVSISSSHN